MGYPQKDQDHQKASPVVCYKQDQYKPGRRGRQYHGKRSRAQGNALQSFLIIGGLASRTIYYLKQGGAVYPEPAMPSFSVAEMVSIRRRDELFLKHYSPTHKTHPPRKQRSHFSNRLSLFWLNILLIPTRIGHMLQYICKGSQYHHLSGGLNEPD